MKIIFEFSFNYPLGNSYYFFIIIILIQMLVIKQHDVAQDL